MSAKLGEILVRENLISPQHLREALDYQREHGGRLGFNLVKLGLISDDMITAVLSRQYGIPSVNLDLFKIDPAVLSLIPQEVVQKHSVLPLSRVGATLTLAMVDPTNVFAMDDVKFMTGLNVEPVVVAEGNRRSRSITAVRARSNLLQSLPTKSSPKTPKALTAQARSLTPTSSPWTVSTLKPDRPKTSKYLKTTRRSIFRRSPA